MLCLIVFRERNFTALVARRHKTHKATLLIIRIVARAVICHRSLLHHSHNETCSTTLSLSTVHYCSAGKKGSWLWGKATTDTPDIYLNTIPVPRIWRKSLSLVMTRSNLFIIQVYQTLRLEHCLRNQGIACKRTLLVPAKCWYLPNKATRRKILKTTIYTSVA